MYTSSLNSRQYSSISRSFISCDGIPSLRHSDLARWRSWSIFADIFCSCSFTLSSCRSFALLLCRVAFCSFRKHSVLQCSHFLFVLFFVCRCLLILLCSVLNSIVWYLAFFDLVVTVPPKSDDGRGIFQNQVSIVYHPSIYIFVLQCTVI